MDSVGRDKPFERMVGTWSGTTYIFNMEGHLLGQLPVNSYIYWLDEDTLIYQESRSAFQDKGGLVLLVDEDVSHNVLRLSLSGRAVQGRSETAEVVGMETMSREFFFQVTLRDGSGMFLNHHRLDGSNMRCVHGSRVGPDGRGLFIQRADFRRVSYDVTELDRRAT